MKKLLLLALMAGLVFGGIWGYKQYQIYELKKAASSYMKDPESAQFRNIFMYKDRLCGEINAKNSFGAYTGFTRFIAMQSGLTYFENDKTYASSSFEKSWNLFCFGIVK